MNTRERNIAAIIPDVASACQPPTILRGFPVTDCRNTTPDNIPAGAVLNPGRPGLLILYGRHPGGISTWRCWRLSDRFARHADETTDIRARRDCCCDDEYFGALWFRLTVPIHPAIISMNSRL
jgi:hypothetical protein